MNSERERQITVNGETRTWRGASLRELLIEAGVDPDSGGLAVALNAHVVVREHWATTAPKPGDKVEIVTVFKGG